MEEKQMELLECVLTEKELLGYGNELSRKNNEVCRLEAQKKATTSEFTAKIDSAKAEINSLAEKVSTGREFRKVEVRTDYNKPKPGMKTIVRLDTGAISSEKNMTSDEIQDLFINKPEEPKEEETEKGKGKKEENTVAGAATATEQEERTPSSDFHKALKWYEETPESSRAVSDLMVHLSIKYSYACELFDRVIDHRAKIEEEKQKGKPAPEKKARKAKTEPDIKCIICAQESHELNEDGLCPECVKRDEEFKKKCAENKKARKPRKQKADTMAVERTLTEIDYGEMPGSAKCEPESGCCVCEVENCEFRKVDFGNAAACRLAQACFKDCPRLIKQ